MEDADFNNFLKLRYQLIFAAKNIGREENISPVKISTVSKDKVGQLKLAHRVVDFVDQANGYVVVTVAVQYEQNGGLIHFEE